MNTAALATLAQGHLDELVDRIGCRMIGTPGNETAASYILETLAEANLDCRRQTYPCPAWAATSCELRLGAQPVEVIPNTFTPPCEIVAGFVLARTLEELEELDVTGRILVLCGEFTRTQLMPLREHAIYLPERDRNIGNLLRKKRPVAVITVSLSPGYVVPLLEDPSLDVPSVTVPAEVGVLLAGRPDQPLALEIATTFEVGETSNVIGQNLAPTGLKRVVACAHYDTKFGTAGARDNAAGTAALLTLAQLCASSSSPISLEFVAFSAEEYSAEDTNDDAYLREYGLTIPPFVFGREIATHARGSGLDDVLVVINFDGIGSLLTPNTLAMMASSDGLKRLVRDVRHLYRGIIEVPPWPASNHYAFYANGIPSIALSSLEVSNITHAPADRIAWVSGERVAEVVGFTHALIQRLADKSPEWARP